MQCLYCLSTPCRLVSQMRAPVAACREPAGKLWQLCAGLCFWTQHAISFNRCRTVVFTYPRWFRTGGGGVFVKWDYSINKCSHVVQLLLLSELFPGKSFSVIGTISRYRELISVPYIGKSFWRNPNCAFALLYHWWRTRPNDPLALPHVSVTGKTHTPQRAHDAVITSLWR